MYCDICLGPPSTNLTAVPSARWRRSSSSPYSTMLLAASGGRPRVDQVTTISLAVRSGSGRRVPKRERKKGRENNTGKTMLKFCRKKIQFATYNSYVRKYKIRIYVCIYIHIYTDTYIIQNHILHTSFRNFVVLFFNLPFCFPLLLIMHQLNFSWSVTLFRICSIYQTLRTHTHIHILCILIVSANQP